MEEVSCLNNMFKKGTDFIAEEDIKNTVCSFVEKIEPCTSDEELVKKIMELSDNSSSRNTD